MGMFRQWRKAAFPVLRRPADQVLTDSLTRAERRQLGYTGAVVTEMPTLATQAASAAEKLAEDIRDVQVVLWVDNWYAERYTTNPDRTDMSTNVTAFAVLALHTTDVTNSSAAVTTRSRRLPVFPGHATLHGLCVNITGVNANVEAALVDLVQSAGELAEVVIESAWVRVPLDEARPARRTLQWRPLTLSEHRVSENEELLYVLKDVLEVQGHTGGVMPLLVDEKIHYTISRMMYSRLFGDHDMLAWLREIPLVYGVWHPYKQAVHLVYRMFFPVFALLETCGGGRQTAALRCHRKLLYMEKMVAALFLCSNSVMAVLRRRLRKTKDAPGN